MKGLRILISTFLIFTLFEIGNAQEHSRARELNDVLLEAIRSDFARPTVHARNLFHISAAMYDAWALYEQENMPYFIGDTINGFNFDFEGIEIPAEEGDIKAAQEEAMAYAAYRLMYHRFLFAPGFLEIEEMINHMMEDYGYDIAITSTSYTSDPSPAVLGNYIAERVIQFGLQDGANEINLYRNKQYRPQNNPMIIKNGGNADLSDPNRWQPIAFDVFIDQSGNVRPSNIPSFLGPEWGNVVPFAMDSTDSKEYMDRFGDSWRVYNDPGPPPYLSENAADQSSEEYKWGFSLVSVWSSMLDPSDGVMWDISPRSIGKIDELPTNVADYRSFYNFFEGGDISVGREINPITGEPYEVQMVPRGDYGRVLAEFWADGPDSETPPGHWFTILNSVMDHPEFTYKWMGQGAILDPLEYDLKAYLTLAGAVHDAAISTWSVKGWYDYIRPVSAIRYMGTVGQSSDTSLTNYNVHGLPLVPDFIEIVNAGDSLLARYPDAEGKIKIKAWNGPTFIEDPSEDVAGVGWLLAEEWWPYQRPTFVTPPFAGYVSGHSTFSRAAAEVLTLMTGDEYFPGGMGVFKAPKDNFLVFEKGPSIDLELQWATYRDASDQTSLSRIWGGIHPPADDIPGRIAGIKIGIDAFNHANSYFNETVSTSTQLPIIENKYSVFPNPISKNQELELDYSGDFNGQKEVRVELVSQSGQLVRSEIIRPGLTGLDMRGLSSGLYFLRISDGLQRQLETIVIP